MHWWKSLIWNYLQKEIAPWLSFLWVVVCFHQLHCPVSKSRWGRSTYQEWVPLCLKNSFHRSERQALSETPHPIGKPRGPVQLRGLEFVQMGRMLAGKLCTLLFSRYKQVLCSRKSANISKKFRLFLSKVKKKLSWNGLVQKKPKYFYFKTEYINFIEAVKLEPMESQRVII